MPSDASESTSPHSKGSFLGLMNIQIMKTRIYHIRLLLETNRYLYLPRASYLDFLAITESGETVSSTGLSTSNYTCVTLYTWFGLPNHTIPAHRGVGFWVHNRVRHSVSIVTPDATPSPPFLPVTHSGLTQCPTTPSSTPSSSL